MRWGFLLLLVIGSAACRPVMNVDLGESGAPVQPEPDPRDGGTDTGSLPTLIIDDDNIDGFASFVLVPGHLIISDTSLDAINLFDLRHIEGDFIVTDNSDLSVMNLSDLETVGGRFVVRDNAALGSINVPALQTTGALVVDDNPELAFFAAGVLESVRDELQWTSRGPSDLTFPTLGAVGSLHFGNGEGGTADTTTALTLSALVVAHGPFVVQDGAALQAVRAPFLSLVNGPLVIADNPVLELVALPNLAQVEGTVCLCDNPVLPTCSVEAILDGVELPSGAPDIEGNDGSASCDG